MRALPRSIEGRVAQRFAQLHNHKTFEDAPCPTCHGIRRYTSNDNCVRCTLWRSKLQKLLFKVAGVRV